jgi:hypothetical protein
VRDGVFDPIMEIIDAYLYENRIWRCWPRACFALSEWNGTWDWYFFQNPTITQHERVELLSRDIYGVSIDWSSSVQDARVTSQS